MRSLHCTILLYFIASDYKSNIFAKFASMRDTFYLISVNLRKTVRKRQKFQPTECHISGKLATLFHLLIAKIIITSTLWKNIQNVWLLSTPDCWLELLLWKWKCLDTQLSEACSLERVRHSQHLTCLKSLGQGWAYEMNVTVLGRRQGLWAPACYWGQPPGLLIHFRVHSRFLSPAHLEWNTLYKWTTEVRNKEHRQLKQGEQTLHPEYSCHYVLLIKPGGIWECEASSSFVLETSRLGIS